MILLTIFQEVMETFFLTEAVMKRFGEKSRERAYNVIDTMVPLTGIEPVRESPPEGF